MEWTELYFKMAVIAKIIGFAIMILIIIIACWLGNNK